MKLFIIISVACVTLHPGVAWASEEASPPSTDPQPQPELEPPTHRAQLNAAVSAYQRGEGESAKLSLARLVNDPTLSDEQLRQQARVYLGEVLYLHQNEEEARRVFEAVLTLDPTFTIDPFAHPPDVCGFFETVRAYIVTPNTLAPVSNGPVPSSAFLGFGLYQFQYGDTRKGARIAALQAAAGAVSLVSFASLMGDRQYRSDETPLSSLKARRSVQWGATAAFYGVWAWSIADAHQHWRANVGIQPGLRPSDDTGDFGMPTRLHFGFQIPMP